MAARGKKPQTSWSPGTDDYRTALVDQNPWWSSGDVPQALAQTQERTLGANLFRVMQDGVGRQRFHVVIGPRRVGKTTAMYQTVRHLLAQGVSPRRILWLRLDHPLLMRVSLGDWVSTYARHELVTTSEQPTYVFLDELTYAEDWDLWLKTFYDEAWPVRVVGSSSSTALLRDRHVESGVGRWDEMYLSPYLFPEYLRLIGNADQISTESTLAETIRANATDSSSAMAEPLRRYLLTGGFPELLLRERASDADERSRLLESQSTLRSDAVERVVYKDIPQAYGVDNPMALERMLYVLAEQATGLLSPKNVCADIQMTTPTFERYLSYLERAFLVFTLQNYAGSEGTKQRRGRKLYFVDGAVRNAALHRGLSPLDDQGELGVLRENLVAGHLHALAQLHQTRLYHWRDGKTEVDLVYDDDLGPLAFEVASSPRHHRGALRDFAERFPRFRGRCYLVAPGASYEPPHKPLNKPGLISIELLVRCAGAVAERALRLRLGVDAS
ncbi:MAG: ATP-binding protein [Phycisphaerales bacterium]|nr:MAG: ATP-binding protein [Phycisphaerales bacterium]